MEKDEKEIKELLRDILEPSRELAMLGLQSDRYVEDIDYRRAVDTVLAVSSLVTACGL